MQAPQRGRRHFCALGTLALAGGALLFLPTGSATAADPNGLSSELYRSIQDAVGLIEQAARHGDRKEVRELDHVLDDLFKTLEREQKQHQHHQKTDYKGGAIHKGMHIAGKDPHPFDSLRTALDRVEHDLAKVEGRLGRGMAEFRHGHEEWEKNSKQHHESKNTGTTSTAKSSSGTTSTSTASTGSSTVSPTASLATKTTGKDHSANLAKGNPSQTTPLAHAAHDPLANIGKMPSAGKQTTPNTALGAKKTSTPAVSPLFALSGHNVGAAVGQHHHAPKPAGKKK